jgi:tetratricopeptide (TPR) repeat protein
MQLTDVDKIATQLRFLKDRPESCVLFLGAGASKSAGIPLAGELASLLLEHIDFSGLVGDCTNKEYATIMSELPPFNRKLFLNEFISKAKLNQTHLYAAALMKAGYIDTVVTVNFDPLMLQALSVLNIFPSVYDMAITREFMSLRIDPPAVVYLHGQSNGFWQLNTEDEMPMALKNIEGLFNNILSTRSIIVVGYSGSDPVFKVLTQVAKYDFGMYWVGYKEEPPLLHVKKELLDRHHKSPKFLPGFTSDDFFRELKNKLAIDEPNIISKPFSHVKETVQIIGEFEIDSLKLPWTSNTLKWIDAAIEGFEMGKGFENIAEAKVEYIYVDKILEKLKEILDQEKYEMIGSIEEKVLTLNDEAATTYLSHIYSNWGVALNNQGRKANDSELVSMSISKFSKAIEINPKNSKAYNNWGSTLIYIGTYRSVNVDLMDEAIQKFRKCTEIDPDFYKAYFNWGNAYARIAKATHNENSCESLNKAIEKYAKATEINPEMHEAFQNWGTALSDLATREGSNSLSLLFQSIEKYKIVDSLKPKKEDNCFNWGNALHKLFGITGEEKYIIEAIEKFSIANSIRPTYETYNNWGEALFDLSKFRSNDEQILNEAIDKYSKSTELHSNYLAYTNWGEALIHLAQSKNFNDNLLREAIDKFIKVLELQPDNAEAYNRWGDALVALIGPNADNENGDELVGQAIDKYLYSLKLDPNQSVVYGKCAHAYQYLHDKRKEDKSLFFKSVENYAKATEIEPGYHVAYFWWGRLLKSAGETEIPDLDLLEQAFEKTKIAIKISKGKDQYLDGIVQVVSVLNRVKSAKVLDYANETLEMLNEYTTIGSYTQAYNKACVNSILLNYDDALHWFEIALKNNDSNGRDYIESDIDFDNIRTLPKFKEILDRYRPAF